MKTPDLYLLTTEQLLRHIRDNCWLTEREKAFVSRLKGVYEELVEMESILEKFDLYKESGLEESISQIVDENIDLINKNNELEQSLKEAESRISMLENNLLDFATTTEN